MRSIIQKIKRRENRFYAAVYYTGKRIRTLRMPAGFPFGSLYRALYYVHISACEFFQFLVRFFYFEPMFRARCESVGDALRIERLPYITGNGRIRIGDNCYLSGQIGLGFNDKVHEDVHITVGDHTFIGHGTTINAAQHVVIGSHCLIARGVRISDFDGHPLSPEARRAHATVERKDVRPITIEDDVWVGTGAMIMKGVTIGAGSVIGATAVVTRDVPPRSIAVGNPARVIGSVDRDRAIAAPSETAELVCVGSAD